MKWLAQGTLYPDVIESGNKTAAKIKSHHNLIPFPEGVHFDLIEPLQGAVQGRGARRRAPSSACPTRSCTASRSPGPGLAVRIIGDITHEKLEMLRRADAIVREEIGEWDTEPRGVAVLRGAARHPSVGVMGDERTYEHPIIIRAVASADAMTADWARLPHDLLAQDEQPHHQRGRRHQPRRLRHHEQAARHDRVGVDRRTSRTPAP